MKISDFVVCLVLLRSEPFQYIWHGNNFQLVCCSVNHFLSWCKRVIGPAEANIYFLRFWIWDYLLAWAIPQRKARSACFAGLPDLIMTLAVIGKGVITAGTAMIYVVLAELYPTVLRNTATGTCSLPARLGGSTSPFFFKIGEHCAAWWKPCSRCTPDALSSFTHRPVCKAPALYHSGKSFSPLCRCRAVFAGDLRERTASDHRADAKSKKVGCWQNTPS